MKKSNILTLLVTITTFYACSVANLPSTPDVYYNEFYISTVEPNCRFINAGIIYTLCKQKNGRFILSKFYPETKTLVSRQEFDDRALSFPHGKYKEFFWKNGSLTLEGSFDANNKKTGTWKEYSYSTGKLITELPYIDGKLNGDLIRYFDSTDLQIQSRIPFNNGLKHGEGFVFDRAGKPIKRYEYLSGNLVNAETALKEDTIINANFSSPLCEKITDEKEKNKCQNEELVRFMNKYFNITDVINAGITDINIEYGFEIDKEGNIKNPIIYKGINEKFNEKFLKMIDMMPKWKPSTVNGIPIISNSKNSINAKFYRPNPYTY